MPHITTYIALLTFGGAVITQPIWDFCKRFMERLIRIKTACPILREYLQTSTILFPTDEYFISTLPTAAADIRRSEERRVGKERSSLWRMRQWSRQQSGMR